jgi:hypothetical protein
MKPGVEALGLDQQHMGAAAQQHLAYASTMLAGMHWWLATGRVSLVAA